MTHVPATRRYQAPWVDTQIQFIAKGLNKENPLRDDSAGYCKEDPHYDSIVDVAHFFPSSTSVLCWGNHLLADDAYGIVVAEQLRRPRMDLEVCESSISRFDLLYQKFSGL